MNLQRSLAPARTLGALALGMLLLAACAPPKEVIGPAQARAMADPGKFHAEFVTTTRREGVRQPFTLLRPAHPKASVILFAGGDGDIYSSPAGIQRAGNFLVRSRALFAEHDLLVAVVDVPSDQSSLRIFRTTLAHALDIKGVIAYLREQSPVPVWLVGTSRGTVSALVVADRLAEAGGPDGVVLSSTFFDRGKEADSVFTADPARVRVPLLLVHHRDDQCPRTPFASAAPFVKRMMNARPAELITFDGGGPIAGNPCEAFHYHGYPGLEPQVVGAISDWILAHPPK